MISLIALSTHLRMNSSAVHANVAYLFRHKRKYWCCCVRGDGACKFFEMITSTWQPTSSSTPPTQCQSPSSPSSRGSRSTLGQALRPTSPAQSQSSWSPSSCQGASCNSMKRRNELLSRSLQIAQSTNDAYIDLIKEFGDCELEDE